MWLAQLVSTAGSSLTDLAAGIYVYQQTNSAFLVGVTLMATAVPSLVVGLVAGVFVDRYDRRSVMIASNLGQAVIVAIIPFLIGVDVSLLFVAILVNAGVKQFFDPAYEALIPEIASDEELTAANAFLQIASFGSTAIGFAAAGLIASQFSISWAFWIDSLTFLFSAACISLLKVRSKPEQSDEETSVGLVLANLKEGLTSVGFVAGSLFMAKYADRLQTGLWVFVGTMGMGIAGVFYGLSPTIGVAIVFVMLSGFFNSPSAVARQTLLQRNTPRELRGRVFSALFVMRDVIFLAGMAAAGLADIINVRVLLIAASLILCTVGAVALFVPGIGRPAAEWRRGATALRAARTRGGVLAPGSARPATVGDFDLLVGRLGTFTRLNDAQRSAFLARATVREVPEGSRVIAQGDPATSAYFILEGEAAAGIPDTDGGYRGLSSMGAGDFFGEIGALTGSTRTADVVVTQPTTLMEVPADALRGVMEVPEVNKLMLSTLTERLLRTNQPDLPRLASMDQAALRDLRTKAPTVEALPKAYAEG